MAEPTNILTSQQIACLGYIRQSVPPEQAIRMAGMDFDEGVKFLAEDERGVQAMEFSKEIRRAAPSITRDLLTAQMYEERARSTTATEGMACLNGIAKLNGLFDNKVVVVQGAEEEESDGKKSLKKIQRMTDDQLIAELDDSGMTIDLAPSKIERKVEIEAEQNDE